MVAFPRSGHKYYKLTSLYIATCIVYDYSIMNGFQNLSIMYVYVHGRRTQKAEPVQGVYL